MEFLSLSGQGGVLDFAISQSIKESMVIQVDDNRKKTLLVSKNDFMRNDVLDYINAFKEANPDAVVETCDKSTVLQLVEKNGDSVEISQSKIQAQVVDIIRAAVNKRASDIHIRVGEEFTRVYFRIDTRLVFHEEYSGERGQTYVNALYQTMCVGNSSVTFKYNKPVEALISETFLTQLGLSGGRFSSRPKDELVIVVIRLLQKRDKALSLSELGLNGTQLEILERVIAIPAGVVFLSGPTNSGKSTLAQSMCEVVTSEDDGIHLITVEDPIENKIHGAVQTPLTVADRTDKHVMEKAWGDAITNLMRMDPDQMFIGEVRDNTSATGAISAAQTGHKVYTTIHTNHPIDIISRLKALNVDSDLITDSSLIVCLIGQRLAPLLCPHCKVPFSEMKVGLSPFHRHLVEKYCNEELVYLPNPEGCDKCSHTGHKGMTGIYEIIETNADFMRVFHEQGKTKAYEYWYRNGGVTLCENVIELVNKGLIDPIFAHKKVCNLDRDDLMFTEEVRNSTLRMAS